jgi:hypothetical protein
MSITEIAILRGQIQIERARASVAESLAHANDLAKLRWKERAEKAEQERDDAAAQCKLAVEANLELQDDLDAALALLRELEWANMFYNGQTDGKPEYLPQCPQCGGLKDDRPVEHRNNCRLAEILKG